MIDINQILTKEPTLTPFGIEGPKTMHSDFGFEQKDITQIQTCIDWLETRQIRKRMNRKCSSYGVKHILENELDTYVTNGCFIAAVIQLGIPYRKIPDSPNIFIPISLKELYKNSPNRG